MKNLLLSFVLIFSFTARAQSYQALNFEMDYGYYYRLAGFPDNTKAIGTGINYENYLKSGIKVSIGLGYYVESQKYSTFYMPDVAQETSTAWHSLLAPVTIGINVLNSKSNFQLFPFAGYTAKLTYLSNSSYTKGPPQTNLKFYGNNVTNSVLGGIETRYIVNKKWFVGATTGVNVFFSHRLTACTAGIKAGILL